MEDGGDAPRDRLAERRVSRTHTSRRRGRHRRYQAAESRLVDAGSPTGLEFAALREAIARAVEGQAGETSRYDSASAVSYIDLTVLLAGRSPQAVSQEPNPRSY